MTHSSTVYPKIWVISIKLLILPLKHLLIPLLWAAWLCSTVTCDSSTGPLQRRTFILTLSEEDGFPGVHAGKWHDVQVWEPRFICIGNGQQVLQVPDLGVDLVPSSLGCSFGWAVHCGRLLLWTIEIPPGVSWRVESGVSLNAVPRLKGAERNKEDCYRTTKGGGGEVELENWQMKARASCEKNNPDLIGDTNSRCT